MTLEQLTKAGQSLAMVQADLQQALTMRTIAARETDPGGTGNPDRSNIMQKGNLTRAEAVAIVGEAAVAKAEAENCEPTNRVGYNGASQGDDLIEWSGSASAEDKYGMACTVTAYYYTSQEDIDAAGDDLGNVTWVIAGYEVV